MHKMQHVLIGCNANAVVAKFSAPDCGLSTWIEMVYIWFPILVCPPRAPSLGDVRPKYLFAAGRPADTQQRREA